MDASADIVDCRAMDRDDERNKSHLDQPNLFGGNKQIDLILTCFKCIPCQANTCAGLCRQISLVSCADRGLVRMSPEAAVLGTAVEFNVTGTSESLLICHDGFLVIHHRPRNHVPQRNNLKVGGPSVTR